MPVLFLYRAMNNAGGDFFGNVGGWYSSSVDETLGITSNWQADPSFSWDQHFIGSYSIDRAYMSSQSMMEVRASNTSSWSSMTPTPAFSYTDEGPFRTILWKYSWNEAINANP